LKQIILDTDPGVDDALAFLFVFNSPEIKVEAVTTVAGNVNNTKSHRNAKQLLEFLDRTDVILCAGAEKPLLKKISHAEDFHGETGLGKSKLPEPKMKSDPRNAIQIIHQKVREHGKDLTLVAIGPLTNIAAAIISDPTLPECVGGLVMMGGAFNLTSYGFGNSNSVAEFNIWHDPHSAKIVFNSGISLVCASLDTTTHPKNRMSVKMFERIRAKNTRTSNLIEDLCEDLVKRFNGFSLHDPQAIAYIIDPTIFRTEKFKVDVETQGELTTGMTVVERHRNQPLIDNKNANIIIDVDADRFHKLFMERILGE
jgi:inosine-uridine nucleoside N-ribohydrolase